MARFSWIRRSGDLVYLASMSRVYICLLCAAIMCGSTYAQTQRLFWDFEGPNGLDGWRMHDGSELQTTAGASSQTAIVLPTAPPLDEFGSSVFMYHPVPFLPDVTYHVALWIQNGSQEVEVEATLAWVDTLSIPVQVDLEGSIMQTFTTNYWRGVELWDENPLSATGTYCLVISGSRMDPDEFLIDNVSVDIIPAGSAHLSAPRLFLGGNYLVGSDRMSTQLCDQGLIPLTEPYTAMGYPQVGGGGGEWCTPAMVDPDLVLYPAVDWVRIELSSALDPSTVVAAKHAVLNALGYVVSYNGQMTLIFDVPDGEYYIAVRHRNHLGVMTAAPVTVAGVMNFSSVDLRSPGQATWGTNARKAQDAHMLLWPGDANGDGVISYTGANNDRDPILIAVGGTTPTNTVGPIYDPRDVNLDGTIMYVGAGNDRDVVLQSIDGVVPTNTRVAQLP